MVVSIGGFCAGIIGGCFISLSIGECSSCGNHLSYLFEGYTPIDLKY
jgi:hypothetical protein